MPHGTRFDYVTHVFPKSWLKHDSFVPGCEYPPGRNIDEICADAAKEKRLLQRMNNAKEKRKKMGL